MGLREGSLIAESCCTCLSISENIFVTKIVYDCVVQGRIEGKEPTSCSTYTGVTLLTFFYVVLEKSEHFEIFESSKLSEPKIASCL